MNSITFLICVLIQFVRTNCDEPPAIVDPKYGEDTYCHFCYFNDVDPSILKGVNVQAKMFGPGQAKGYKIVFGDLPNGVLETLVQDSNEFACGMAYLLPVSEFQKMLKYTLNDNKKKYRNMITVTVDVTKDGQQLSMKCNTYQTIDPPKGNELVCKSDLQLGINAYTAAHLSDECIGKLQEIPTDESC